MPRDSSGDDDEDAFRQNSFKICCKIPENHWSTILCTANSQLTMLFLHKKHFFGKKKQFFWRIGASNPGCDLRSQLLKELLLHVFYFYHHIIIACIVFDSFNM